MKKSLLLASLLIISSSSLMASKVGDTFVGVEFSTIKVDDTSSGYLNGTKLVDQTSTTNLNSIGIKFGKYYDFGRLGANLSYSGKKDNIESTTIVSLGYDYMIYNSSKFTPFVGASLGYSKSDIDVTYSGYNFNYPISGLNYGLSLGVEYEINDKIDLELGARYMFSNASGDDSVVISGNTVKLEDEVNNIQQYYIGVNYKF